MICYASVFFQVCFYFWRLANKPRLRRQRWFRRLSFRRWLRMEGLRPYRNLPLWLMKLL